MHQSLGLEKSFEKNYCRNNVTPLCDNSFSKMTTFLSLIWKNVFGSERELSKPRGKNVTRQRTAFLGFGLLNDGHCTTNLHVITVQ